MHFARASGADYFPDVAGVKAASRQDRDPISALLDKGSKNGRASLSIGSAA